MKQYLKTVEDVYNFGRLYPDRTGKGRIRVFGGEETYDLSKGFPAVTTRKLFLRMLVKELCGFIHGSNLVADLGSNFWSKWSPTEDDVEIELDRIREDAKVAANEEMSKMFADERSVQALRNYLMKGVGTIGPMYGVLWRRFPRVQATVPDWFKGIEDIPSDVLPVLKTDFMRQVLLSQGSVVNDEETFKRFAIGEYFKTYDQLNMVYLNLKRNPFSSRHRVTAFHPDMIGSESITPKQNVLTGQAALAPCHTFYQFMVTEKVVDGEIKLALNCMFYMSSSDVMVGRPYNICQYALLTMIMAHCLDYLPGELKIVSCDTHIYANHKEGAEEQLTREPLPLAQLVLPADKKDLFAFTPDDIQIVEYEPHPAILLDVAV